MDPLDELEDEGGGGWVKKILIIGAGILAIWVASKFVFDTVGAYDPVAKSQLRKLFTACNVYWAEYGDGECNPSLAAQYGFDKHPDVTLSGGGTISTFLATAQHKDSGTAFTINADGDIAQQ